MSQPGTPVSPTKYAPNKPDIYTNQFTVVQSGQPKPLSPVKIPDGFALVIKAMKGNTGTITIGYDANSASNTSKAHFKLAPNESVKYLIQNASVVWVDGTVAGDGVELTVELDSSPPT